MDFGAELAGRVLARERRTCRTDWRTGRRKETRTQRCVRRRAADQIGVLFDRRSNRVERDGTNNEDGH